jgi:hypothetical protein
LYLGLGGLAVMGWVSGHLDLVNKLFNWFLQRIII